MAHTSADAVDFGERVEGIAIPVFNERAVRAAAGLLFIVGFTAVTYALFSGDFQPVRAFGVLFLIDMGIRLGLNHRFAPSMALGALIVRRQRPEWVGAAPKRLAWGLGFGMAFVGCLGMGWFGIQNEYMLLFCSLCLGLMFLETAFGICVGCELYRLFAKEKPQLCPGDVCEYTPPSRRSLFSSEPKSEPLSR